MINESNAHYNQQAENHGQNGSQASSGVDREFQGLISSAIERAVSQYHGLLRQGLDLEALLKAEPGPRRLVANLPFSAATTTSGA